MACIKSAQRSALVAFAPDAPYLAAGTMAGAVDLSFSSSANLEIFSLDFHDDAPELPVAAACPSADRFNRLSWGKPPTGPGSEGYGLGLVAGGLGDGSIAVWNPLTMIRSQEQGGDDAADAFVAKLEKHVGPVRGLEFNALVPTMLASGADEGELCIWDLSKPTEPSLFPSLKSVGSGAQSEVSFVSWNPKFNQILSSTSYNGITVVWDLRHQKPVTSFADSTKRRCSVLQWNPDVSTQLIIASDDDSSPALRVWDVRKTISPLREFVGHTKGVIAMSWCPYDSSFLLTCAKDNRTICWDTVSGEIVSELPASTNWNFDIHWYPKIPGIISASSFDVKVGIYNIEACSRSAAGAGDYGAPVRLRAPKWLKRPTGVSFSFGGKLVSFQPSPSPQGSPATTSEVFVHNLVTEQSLVSRSSEFETAIQNGEKGSLLALCERKSRESISEEDKETWGFLKVLFGEDGTARSKMLSHLGFSLPEGDAREADYLGEKLSTLTVDQNFLSGGPGSPFPLDNGDDFFNNLQPSNDNVISEEESAPNEEQVEKEPEVPAEPSDTTVDDNIQRALVVGDYKGAVLQCISANRMADALIIAHAGSTSLWERTRDEYIKSSLSPYLKIVSAMVNNDLMGLVSTRPLNSWKETLALVCTFASKDEWAVLCDTLASRLMTVGNTLAATLCYICAGNVDKTVEIWSRNLKSDGEGRSYVDLLQDLMEKTIVLAVATGHKQFSASLSKLVENYAELLASQGLLSTAMEYLKLLGSGETSHELAILRDRIALAAEEKEAPRNLPYQGSAQPETHFGTEQPAYGAVSGAPSYTQDNSMHQPQPTAPVTQYNSYQPQGPAYGGYQPGQPNSQYGGSVVQQFQPMPVPTPTSAHMFVPAQNAPNTQQQYNSSLPVPHQAKPFVPAPSIPLRNVEQYQQPSLGSQLYPGATNQGYPSGPVPPQGIPPHQGTASGFMPQAPQQAPRTYVPGAAPNFPQRPGFSPAQQPSSPTNPPQVQPAVAPPAPAPTVETADTSNVPADWRPIIQTLTRLFSETSAALGGSNANPGRRREIEDNSRKIGVLFSKLNTGDISPNAASKLVQLCQALDSGDFSGALHIQVGLTTSDWDECHVWLVALKRMIKTRQNIRL